MHLNNEDNYDLKIHIEKGIINSINPVHKVTGTTSDRFNDQSMDDELNVLRKALINVKLCRTQICDAFYKNELDTPTSNTFLNTVQNFLTNNF